MVAALHGFAHPTWFRFWGSGSLVKSKLLLASILDAYKLFGHMDMLSIGIWYQPYAVIPILLGADFGA
jgi:hypothetical protein